MLRKWPLDLNDVERLTYDIKHTLYLVLLIYNKNNENYDRRYCLLPGYPISDVAGTRASDLGDPCSIPAPAAYEYGLRSTYRTPGVSFEYPGSPLSQHTTISELKEFQ